MLRKKRGSGSVKRKGLQRKPRTTSRKSIRKVQQQKMQLQKSTSQQLSQLLGMLHCSILLFQASQLCPEDAPCKANYSQYLAIVA